MDFAVCLLFGVFLINGVSGLQEESGLPEDPINSLQAQLDFLMQKVSELSRTSALQKVEIDYLKKENQNLLQFLSEVKSTQQLSQKIPDNSYEEEKNFDVNKARETQSVIRKERLLIPLPQTTPSPPKENVVAFYAYMSGDFLNPAGYQTLIYDTVITNEGNGYHSATGNFIAPQTGFYVFSWTMRLANGEYHQAELVHNHKVMGVAYLYAPTGDHMVSDVACFHVNQGDDVFVRTQSGPNHGNIESGYGGRSSFTGWKLN